MAKILIVDDDIRTAEFISQSLQAAGHECAVTRKGEESLHMAKAGPIDLLVLDVMLPGGVSGFEVCRRFRADSDLYTLPILLLSAMAGEEEVMHGLAQGADDYVTKPFAVPNLVQRVEALLRASADAQNLDEMTSLPCTQSIKREVQKRISRHEIFALVCVELVRLREFAYKCGAEARKKAIRHLARTLRLCGQEMGSDDFMVGHMGGGYFVCILNTERAEKYCDYIMQTWKAHLPSLYESVGFGRAYQDVTGDSGTVRNLPLLDLLICVTTRLRKETLSSQELFEILMKIRSNALAKNQAGLYFDRRA